MREEDSKVTSEQAAQARSRGLAISLGILVVVLLLATGVGLWLRPGALGVGDASRELVAIPPEHRALADAPGPYYEDARVHGELVAIPKTYLTIFKAPPGEAVKKMMTIGTLARDDSDTSKPRDSVMDAVWWRDELVTELALGGNEDHALVGLSIDPDGRDVHERWRVSVDSYTRGLGTAGGELVAVLDVPDRPFVGTRPDFGDLLVWPDVPGPPLTPTLRVELAKHLPPGLSSAQLARSDDGVLIYGGRDGRPDPDDVLGALLWLEPGEAGAMNVVTRELRINPNHVASSKGIIAVEYRVNGGQDTEIVFFRADGDGEPVGSVVLDPGRGHVDAWHLAYPNMVVARRMAIVEHWDVSDLQVPRLVRTHDAGGLNGFGDVASSEDGKSFVLVRLDEVLSLTMDGPDTDELSSSAQHDLVFGALAADRGRIVITDAKGGLSFVDASDPISPMALAYLPQARGYSGYGGLDIRGDRLYATNLGEVAVFDMTDLGEPALLARHGDGLGPPLAAGDSMFSIEVDERHRLGTIADSAVLVYDMSTPDVPRLMAETDLPMPLFSSLSAMPDGWAVALGGVYSEEVAPRDKGLLYSFANSSNDGLPTLGPAQEVPEFSNACGTEDVLLVAHDLFSLRRRISSHRRRGETFEAVDTVVLPGTSGASVTQIVCSAGRAATVDADGRIQLLELGGTGRLRLAAEISDLADDVHIALDGDHLFATVPNGLHVYDISDLDDPRPVGFLSSQR